MSAVRTRFAPELILLVASRVGCDPRTAVRLLQEGPEVVRSKYIRARAVPVLQELGIDARIGGDPMA